MENEEDECFKSCFAENKEADIETHAREKDNADKTKELDEKHITR